MGWISVLQTISPLKAQHKRLGFCRRMQTGTSVSLAWSNFHLGSPHSEMALTWASLVAVFVWATLSTSACWRRRASCLDDKSVRCLADLLSTTTASSNFCSKNRISSFSSSHVCRLCEKQNKQQQQGGLGPGPVAHQTNSRRTLNNHTHTFCRCKVAVRIFLAARTVNC